MSRLEKMKQSPIHSRYLDIRTFGCDENSIIVEGELKDDRLQPYYRLSGEFCQPHAVHQLLIRMHVTGPNLQITDIEAEFHKFPREECPYTADSLQRIKGWKIAPGFTQKAKEALGGKAGCVHLTALFLTMAPAAVQGFWSYHARKPLKEPISPTIMERFLIDTCWSGARTDRWQVKHSASSRKCSKWIQNRSGFKTSPWAQTARDGQVSILGARSN